MDSDREPRPPSATVDRAVAAATWASAGQWSPAERMNELETTMWRSERHPQRSSTICSLMILDHEPDWDRLVAAHEWATRLVTRTRQRVVEPLLPTGSPAWVRDPHFALAYHLRRIQLGTRNTLADLLEVVQSMAITPFDQTRPMWEALLIEGLDGGRAAYLLKLHHSLTDGLGAMQLLSLVQSRTREHIEDKPIGAEPDRPLPDPPDRLSLTVHGALHVLSGSPKVAAVAMSTTRQVLTDPVGTASGALRFMASLRRVLSPPPAPPSPLFAARNARVWIFRTLECPLVDLKAAGKAAGGSVNDAYLAALLGGLRRYHEHHATTIEQLSTTVPVSLRRADDPLGGNKFAGAMLAAPIGVVDPAERIAELRAAILSQLTEPALDSFSIIAPLVNRLPSAIGAAVIGAVANTDLSASNVPGVPYDVYMAGARVDRVFPFGPLPGVAVMAAMVTHVGTCCIGLNVDGGAVPDIDALMHCMQEGLDEVLALAPRQSAVR